MIIVINVDNIFAAIASSWRSAVKKGIEVKTFFCHIYVGHASFFKVIDKIACIK